VWEGELEERERFDGVGDDEREEDREEDGDNREDRDGE